MSNESVERPDLKDEEEVIVEPEYDTPPPEGGGPASSVEDFEPEDPDPEAIVDEA